MTYVVPIGVAQLLDSTKNCSNIEFKIVLRLSSLKIINEFISRVWHGWWLAKGSVDRIKVGVYPCNIIAKLRTTRRESSILKEMKKIKWK